MTEGITITTNNHPREWLSRYEVPDRVLADQFDWLDEDCDYGFIKYRGNWYHVSQFMRFGYPDMGITQYGYHAYLNDSMCSGVMIKNVDDDRVVVATFCS